MQDLKTNETLINLKSRLLSQTSATAQTGATPLMPRRSSEPSEEEKQQQRTPDEIVMAIYEKRIVLFLSSDFAHTVADAQHRPEIQIHGDSLVLVRERKTTKNCRRIGTQIENGGAVQFSIENHMIPGLNDWLDGFECGKSTFAIKWIAKDVWRIDLDRESARTRRKVIKHSRSYASRSIVGAIPKGEEPSLSADTQKEPSGGAQEHTEAQKAPEPTPKAADPTPGPLESEIQASEGDLSIRKIRAMIKSINDARMMIGEDLVFSIDSEGLIHATLRLA